MKRNNIKKLITITLFVIGGVSVDFIVNNEDHNIGIGLSNVEALASGESSGIPDYRNGELICSHCDKEVEGCIACVEDGCSCDAPDHSC